MKVPRLLSQLTHDLPEEGQLVVYDEKGEKLVVLNDVGAAIYCLIDGINSLDQIVAFVSQTLPQKSLTDCRQEVEAFLTELEKEGVVEWRDREQASVSP